VTVPVTGFPPVTVSGFSEREAGFTLAGGSTLMPPFAPMPAIVA
jgi:hypothetical protein